VYLTSSIPYRTLLIRVKCEAQDISIYMLMRGGQVMSAPSAYPLQLPPVNFISRQYTIVISSKWLLSSGGSRQLWGGIVDLHSIMVWPWMCKRGWRVH